MIIRKTIVSALLASIIGFGCGAQAEQKFVKTTDGTEFKFTNPKGFGDIHYDKTPSPIGIFGRGPSNSIFFGGGLIDAANVVVKTIKSPSLLPIAASCAPLLDLVIP